MRQGRSVFYRNLRSWALPCLCSLISIESTSYGALSLRCDQLFSEDLNSVRTRLPVSENLQQHLDRYFTALYTDAAKSLTMAEKKEIFSQLTQAAIQEGMDPKGLIKRVQLHKEKLDFDQFNQLLNRGGGSNYAVLDQERLEKLKSMPMKMRFKSSPEKNVADLLEENLQKTEYVYSWRRVDLGLEAIPIFESVQALPDSPFAREIKPYFKTIDSRNIKYIRHVNSHTIEALFWYPHPNPSPSNHQDEFSYVWIMLQKNKEMGFNSSLKWNPVAFYSFSEHPKWGKGNPSVIPFLFENGSQVVAFVLRNNFMKENVNQILTPRFDLTAVHVQRGVMDLSEIPRLSFQEVEFFQEKVRQSLKELIDPRFPLIPTLHFNAKQKSFSLFEIISISSIDFIYFKQISTQEKNDVDGWIEIPTQMLLHSEADRFVYFDPIHSFIIFAYQERHLTRFKGSFYGRFDSEWGPQENVRYILPKHDLEVVPKD